MRIAKDTIYFEGELTKFTVPAIAARLQKQKIEFVKILNLENLEQIDSAGVALLNHIRDDLPTQELAIVGMNDEIQNAFDTFDFCEKSEDDIPEDESFLEKLGGFFYAWIETARQGLYMTADIAYWSVIGIFRKKGSPRSSVIGQSLLIGVDAIGIIALLSFIIGVIIALQSAAQLRQFGANIFIADLIAISMVREMGPMMTAIIIAGRSGSAIASEIATMKVTEEMDALKMMALDPIRYVVVPKFHAITICMPLLVTIATLIGIGGGLIVAVVYLDLSVVSYINEAIQILTLKDVVVGLLKSVLFAWVIVIIASYYGFSVKGGAEGVGKVTTASVVASIFWVIVLDALNSIIFYF